MMGPITGILASRNLAVSEFFTTVLYPSVVDESLGINPLHASSGEMGFIRNSDAPEDAAAISQISIVSGSLQDIVHFYDEQLATESVAMALSATSGILTEITRHDIADENISIPMLAVVSSSLDEIVVNYTAGAVEELAITQLQIITGTLT